MFILLLFNDYTTPDLLTLQTALPKSTPPPSPSSSDPVSRSRIPIRIPAQVVPLQAYIDGVGAVWVHYQVASQQVTLTTSDGGITGPIHFGNVRMVQRLHGSGLSQHRFVNEPYSALFNSALSNPV